MKKKRIKVLLIVFLCVLAFGIGAICGVNYYVKLDGGKNILTMEEAAGLSDVDCVLVLGCQVWDDGRPSGMLSDRIKRGVALYKNGVSGKIIMSGDHGRKDYDEVNTMKQVAIDSMVPSSDVFMDHAGFSTYESLYRAKEIFEADKIIVVTQKYHLYRALYIAKRLGIEAYGVDSDYRAYGGQEMREAREILARCKDFVTTIFKPEPTYLGDVIPVSGDGNVTND